MRPRGEEYQRFIHLVDCFRDAGWDDARMVRASPFRVADIATNSILLRAERDLLALAGRFGSAAEQTEIAERIERMERAIGSLWHQLRRIFVSRDLITGTAIDVATSAGLLPLFGGGVPAEQVRTLTETLRRWAQSVPYLVPSTAPDDPRFEPRRYWRGPIWAVVNWMIAEGLSDCGERALAQTIRTDTKALIDAAGFSEYFDPLTGEGIGGGRFSWTAAVALMLA